MEDYFIKAGYQPNKQPLTFEGDQSGSYWTNDRINMATEYQYYVYKKCSELLRNHHYSNLLDVGCGPPVKVKQHLLPYCNSITLIDQPSLATLAQQILPESKFISVNLENIELELGEKFDLIVCADVLEHLLNPNYCLRFIKQHLASNGLAVLSTPERNYLRGRACNYSPKPEHVREWNSTEFANYIKSQGFKIVEHFLTAQRRLRIVEHLIATSLSHLIKLPRWSSCQIVICKIAS